MVEVAHDARVGELGQHARLLIEARLLDGGARMQDLERDQRAGLAIDRLIHGPHAAHAGLVLELVAFREGRTAPRRARCHRGHYREP